MTTLLKALSLSAIMAFAAPAYSQIMLNVGIGLPHVGIALNVGSPMPHAMWVPGYYADDGRMSRRAWIPGRWQVPPERYREEARFVREGDRYDRHDGYRQDRRSREDVRYRPEDGNRNGDGRNR